MPHFRQLTASLFAASLALTSALTCIAQDAPAEEVSMRAQMASMALEQVSLPSGYMFSGETFLTAEQIVSGTLTADDLTEAGFITQYLSIYINPESGALISSYVSSWTDGEAATAGFTLIEDESLTHPDGVFEDSDAGVGEAPGETTTGSWTDPSGVTVAIIDTTFRMDRYLVGTSQQTRDASAPDPTVVSELAGAIEARATAAVGGQNPEGVDLALVPQALPLFTLAPSLQTGFLGAQDVEQMYGLQGSSLGGLTASWTDVVGLGEASSAPYLSVGLTQFETPEDAQAVIDQFVDLSPDVPGAEQVEGFELEGADASSAFMFPSMATGSEAADSFRIVAVVESTLLVVDVQAASSVQLAQSTATELAGAQLECIGAISCAVPVLPVELTGN